MKKYILNILPLLALVIAIAMPGKAVAIETITSSAELYFLENQTSNFTSDTYFELSVPQKFQKNHDVNGTTYYFVNFKPDATFRFNLAKKKIASVTVWVRSVNANAKMSFHKGSPTGEEISPSSGADYVNGGNDPKIVTYNFTTDDNANTDYYILSENTSGSDANLRIGAIFVSLTDKQEPVDSYYLWTANDNIANGSLYGDNHFKYIGTGYNYNSSTTINVRGNNVGTYPLTANDAVGFQIKKGLKGTIRVYASWGTTSTGSSDTDPTADKTELTPASTGTNVANINFDLTSATDDQQYWFAGAGNLAAIEVIPTESYSNDKLNTLYEYMWKANNVLYVQNYTDGNNLYFDGNGVVTDNSTQPVVKPNSTYTVNYNSGTQTTVPIFAYNSMTMKLQQGHSYRLKLYYTAVESIYPIIKIGTFLGSESNTTTQDGTNGQGLNTTTTYQYEFTIGESDPNILWIYANGFVNPLYLGAIELTDATNDDPLAACVQGNNASLTTIDSHYLWKGTTNLTAGYTDAANKIVYRGNGATYMATPTIVTIEDYIDSNGNTTNQGTNGIYRADGHDHWALKVDDGKIGTIKVYYSSQNEVIDLTDPNIKFEHNGDGTSITFTAGYECKDLIYYFTPQNWNNFQYVKIDFDRPTIIPMSLYLRDAASGEKIEDIPVGSTTAFVYIGSGIDLTQFQHLQLQATGGFTESDFSGNSVTEDTDNKNKTHTIKIKAVTLVEAPIIGKGASENTRPHEDSTFEVVTPSLKTLADGTKVLVYGFNHEAYSNDQVYWISGVPSVVRIGAIEVLIDLDRQPGAYDYRKLATTVINEIPASSGSVTVDSDGHKTLHWRVYDFKESEGGNNVLYLNNYYQPAGGGQYFQYIYYNKTTDQYLPITTNSDETSAGSTDKDKSTIFLGGNHFGQVFKLEKNTMYRITLYSKKNEVQLMRYVKYRGLDAEGNVNVLPKDGLLSTTIKANGTTTIEFVTGSNEEDCYFWILGRNASSGLDNNYVGFDLTYIQSVTDRTSTNTYESAGLDGTAGAYYRTVSDNHKLEFPIKPRAFAATDGIFYKDTKDNQLQLKDKGTLTMNVMLGTDGTYIYRSESGVTSYFQGGLVWKEMATQSNNGGFLDGIKTYTQGDNNKNHGGSYDSGNANPQTESNGGIGGEYTEYGGKFLQPVSGDFFRFEPEYDGVVTVWFLQNGNTDAHTPRIWEMNGDKVKIEDGKPVFDKDRGNMTRRPVYVVDENGYIMRQSTTKPDHDYSKGSHYAINGTWADINDFAWVRDDWQNGWRWAMEKWKMNTTNGVTHTVTQDGTTYTNTDKTPLSERYRETLIFYGQWYDGGTYDYNNPDDKMTINSIDTNAGKLDTHDDDRCTYVNETQLIGHMVYGSDVLRPLERKWLQDYINRSSNDFSSIDSQNRYAKYGYEVPVHVNVRYVFPVRAGKTYYIGGRGTKNGFASVKFEPMPANYNPTDYKKKNLNTTVTYPTSLKGKYDLDWVTADGGKTYSATGYASSYGDVPVLTLDDSKSNSISWTDGEGTALASAPAANTTVHAFVKRTFEANKWYPIVLPFSVSESKMRRIFGPNVKVIYLDPRYNARTGTDRTKGTHTDLTYTINNNGTVGAQKSETVTDDWYSVYAPAVDNKTLHFTRHYYQMLYANMPAFICPSDAPTYTDTDDEDVLVGGAIDFGYVNFAGTTIDEYEIGGGYKVTGSYSTTTASNNGAMYYMSNVDSKAVVYHSASGIDMKPMRVWIKPIATGVKNVPLSTVSFGTYDGEDLDMGNAQAGIEDIVMDDITIDMYNNDDNVYDLMGRVVGHGSLNGLTPGIYIFHGQKHYIR